MRPPIVRPRSTRPANVKTKCVPHVSDEHKDDMRRVIGQAMQWVKLPDARHLDALRAAAHPEPFAVRVAHCHEASCTGIEHGTMLVASGRRATNRNRPTRHAEQRRTLSSPGALPAPDRARESTKTTGRLRAALLGCNPFFDVILAAIVRTISAPETRQGREAASSTGSPASPGRSRSRRGRP